MRKKALASFEILKRHIIPANWVGNPLFLNSLDFEQDKVEPLHVVFDKTDTKGSMKIIDEFIVFNKKLLALGVMDKSFNITKNYGLADSGAIVLIDIGELFDDSEQIQKQLIDRAWGKEYVAGCIQNEEVRKYFVQKMDENFGL